MRITNRQDKIGTGMLLAPSLAGFLVFFLLPFVTTVFYSFLSSPINPRFVALQNYISLLSNKIFLRAAFNTIVFTALCVPSIMLISLGIAFLLNKKLYGRNVLKTMFILPLVVPVASVVMAWSILFGINGSLNGLMAFLSMNPVDWMNSGWSRWVILALFLWKNTGYNIVIFLAGLRNIPIEYYEAARINGATAWDTFRKVTLVYLTPTSFFVLIISIINSFRIFKETYLLAGPYPNNNIYILQHYMNNMFKSLDYQKLTSAACLMAILIYLLVFFLFKLERRISKTIV